ncbi:MAG: thioredoxin fold domain-containing protein [Aureispira sp.]
MKTVFFILLSLWGSAQLRAGDDGIDFFKGTLAEAQEKAAQEHKLIFMDAYTAWCGPCKQMSRNVFTAPEVGAFFNKHFVNIKVDMEKGEGPRLAGRYRVSSYPTLLFLDEKGEVVHAAKGSRPADQFLGLGKTALSKNDKSDEYAQQYEEGDRSPELLRAYAYALLTGGKPATKIANQYIRQHKDFNNEEGLDFLYDFANDADSKIFDLFLEHQDAILKAKGKDAYYTKVHDACDAVIQKAIEFDTKSLVEVAKNKMKKAYPSFYKEYSLLADINYAAGKENMDDYTAAADKYLKKYAKKKGDVLHQYAQAVGKRVDDKALLEKALKWVNQSLELDQKAVYWQTKGFILRKLKRDEEAQKAFEKARSLGGLAPTLGHGH